MIKHIVFWDVAQEGRSKGEVIKDFKSKLEALPAMIDEIVELEVGIDFNGADTAFDVALYSVFNSKEDLQKYQVHPEHQKVVEFVKQVAVNRAVVDYEI